MSIVLDVLLVALFVLFIVLGVKKGVLVTIFELVAVALALFCAFKLATPMANGVYSGVLEKSMINKINDEMAEKPTPNNETKTEYALLVLPEYAKSVAKCVGIDTDEIAASVKSKTQSTSADIAEMIVVNVVKPIAVGALNVIFFFLLSALFIVILRLIAKALSESAKVSVVKEADAIFGGIVGALKGVAALIIAATLLTMMMAGGGEDDIFTQAINESRVIALVNEHINPFIGSLKDAFLNIY